MFQIVAIILVIIIPLFLVVLKRLPQIYEMLEILETPFVCPNCGHSFNLKWYQVWYKFPSFYLLNGLKHKCPKCKQTDICFQSHR